MSAILAIVFGLLVVAADQLSKYLVITQMAENEVIRVIPGLLNFNRIPPNAGAAFGILQGHTWFLITITVFIMVICVSMLIRKTFDSKWMFWSLCLVLAGGIGNLIDRLFRGGNVVDFLEFGFFEFPVFNIADCAVCVGAFMMVIYFIGDFIKDARNKKKQIAVIEQESTSEAVNEPVGNSEEENDASKGTEDDNRNTDGK